MKPPQDSGSSSDERSPVMRRVFGGQAQRETQVLSRDVTKVPARAESHDSSSENAVSPVVVRRAHTDVRASLQVFADT